MDLAIIKTEGQTETQQRVLIRKVEKKITSGLSEIEIPELTSKQKNFRKTAYTYEKTTEKVTPGLQNLLILEINSFANPVPYAMHPVDCMIAQFLKDMGNTGSITEYNLQPFELLVLGTRGLLLLKRYFH